MASKFVTFFAKSLISNSKSSLNSVYSSYFVPKRNLSSYKHPHDYTFRQLFDYDTNTYTYIVGDVASRLAIIIDPVLEHVQRDSTLLKELKLDLKYAVNTHIHADHITGSGELCKIFKNCKSVISKHVPADAGVYVGDGDYLDFGKFKLECIETPGHTNGCITYVWKDKEMLFTGDTLFVRGCGRTDFQEGNPKLLYDVVHKKIFSLPSHYLIYPGHDYNGHTVTTVYEEKVFNPRFSKPEAEYLTIMKNLKLNKPRLIDVAVPHNMVDGLAENLKKV